jgi:hypothetical protein
MLEELGRRKVSAARNRLSARRQNGFVPSAEPAKIIIN